MNKFLPVIIFSLSYNINAMSISKPTIGVTESMTVMESISILGTKAIVDNFKNNVIDQLRGLITMFYIENLVKQNQKSNSDIVYSSLEIISQTIPIFLEGKIKEQIESNKSKIIGFLPKDAKYQKQIQNFLFLNQDTIYEYISTDCDFCKIESKFKYPSSLTGNENMDKEFYNNFLSTIKLLFSKISSDIYQQHLQEADMTIRSALE